LLLAVTIVVLLLCHFTLLLAVTSCTASLPFYFATCGHHCCASDVVFVGSNVFGGRSGELLCGTNAISGLSQCVNVHRIFRCNFLHFIAIMRFRVDTCKVRVCGF
jgi:hypothetical protein